MKVKRILTPGEIIERNIIFLFAVFLGGFGVAVVTLAEIGTTPISSPNYVISLHSPLTLGMVTMIFNFLLMVLQVFIVGLKYARAHALVMLLQVPVTAVFASSIDLGMFALKPLLPEQMSYLGKLCLILAGSGIMAFGISLQVSADVAMVSGEAFVKALSQRLKKEFGLVKTCFDLSLVLSAVILSLILSGFSTVEGVREGTVIGALSIGPTVRLLLPRIKPRLERFFTRRNLNHDKSAAGLIPAARHEQFKPVITITRQYGCGGRMIGKKVAQALNIKFYDNELIALISRESGLDQDLVERKEGRLDSALLYQMVMQDFSVPLDKSLSSADAMFVATSRVIRSLSMQHSCVIVGRGADQVLKDNPYVLSVYLYADADYKIKFCHEHYQQNEMQARESMRRQDNGRSEYYQQYFHASISDPRNYQICLNVGALGIERCCSMIIALYQQIVAIPEAQTT